MKNLATFRKMCYNKVDFTLEFVVYCYFNIGI